MFKKSGSLLRNVPDIPVLQQLLDKCFQTRGEKAQVFWRNSENQLFILEVFCSLKDGRPYWQLIRERSGRRTMIAEYTGHDILLVYKQISTATADAQEERASDESSRVSRTRSARAAASTWLEGKTDGKAEQTNSSPNPTNAGGIPNPYSASPSTSSAAAAAEDSPWAMTPAQARADNDSWPPVPAITDNPAYQATPRQAPPQAKPSGGGANPPAPSGTANLALPDIFNLNTTKLPPPQQMQAKAQKSAGEKNKKNPLAHPDKAQNGPAPAASTPLNASAANQSGGNPAKSTPPKAVPGVSTSQPMTVNVPQAARQAAQNTAQQAATAGEKAANLGKAALPTSGDLGDTSIVKLLKQLKVAQVTARLEFVDGDTEAFVYVEDGRPVEAWLGELKGDSALLEILLLSSGKYTMMIGMTPINRNVKTSPEVLIEHNRNIASLLNELAEEGLTSDSKFAPADAKLSSQEFDAQATPDAPMELEKLASLYVKLDGKKTLAQLNELQVLSRPLLIQAIHHLYFNGIIDIVGDNPQTQQAPPAQQQFSAQQQQLLPQPPPQPAQPLPTQSQQQQAQTSQQQAMFQQLTGQQLHSYQQPPTEQSLQLPAQAQQPAPQVQPDQSAKIYQAPSGKKPLVVPKAIDGAAIQSVMLSLRRVDTGLFIYPAFLYFLQEEFYRIYRAKGTMSVLIFEMRELSATDGLVRRVSLSTDAIADATMRMSKCKRHTDVLAHYEMNDFAVILPSTGASGAKVFAHKIIKTLTQAPLIGTAGKKLSFSFGGASMPEDFKDVASLLGAAELAMNQARQSGKPLVMYKEIDQ